MTILSSIKELRELEGELSQYFKQNQSPSFNNMLWQIIVNNSLADRDIVFTAVHHKNMLQVTLVENNVSGHYPLFVEFADGVDYDKAVDVCLILSERVFGSSAKRTDMMVLKSMSLPEKVEASQESN